MMKIILMCITIFIEYVLYVNLDWRDFEGIVLICLTIGVFVMNELRIIIDNIKKAEKDTDAD